MRVSSVDALFFAYFLPLATPAICIYQLGIHPLNPSNFSILVVKGGSEG